MKKIFMILVMSTLIFTVVFAEAHVGKIDGNKVDIVFTFKDNSATQMSVIGNFCDWTEPGVPMTKNAKGLWEVTIPTTLDAVLVYKFWTKGTYIFDFKAPAKMDDGFGGNNGFVEVAKLVAISQMEEGGKRLPGSDYESDTPKWYQTLKDIFR